MPIAFNPADPAQAELIADYESVEDFKHDCCAECDNCGDVHFIGQRGELASKSFALSADEDGGWLCWPCDDAGVVPSGQSAGDMRAEYGTLFAINGGA